jgi:hypothetical protein
VNDDVETSTFVKEEPPPEEEMLILAAAASELIVCPKMRLKSGVGTEQKIVLKQNDLGLKPASSQMRSGSQSVAPPSKCYCPSLGQLLLSVKKRMGTKLKLPTSDDDEKSGDESDDKNGGLSLAAAAKIIKGTYLNHYFSAERKETANMESMTMVF